jgi:hypothetical protein
MAVLATNSDRASTDKYLREDMETSEERFSKCRNRRAPGLGKRPGRDEPLSNAQKKTLPMKASRVLPKLEEKIPLNSAKIHEQSEGA